MWNGRREGDKLGKQVRCAFCGEVIEEGERRVRFIDDDDVVHDKDKCILGYARRYLIQYEVEQSGATQKGVTRVG